MTRAYQPNGPVWVAGAPGRRVRPAITVDGKVTRGGRIKIRIAYPAPISGGMYGAIRSVREEDVRHRYGRADHRWGDPPLP